VLAVWTEKSVNKEWVLNEAEIGKKRGILVPVMLDEVEPPLGFSEIQAAKLEPWNELLDSIGNILGQAPVTPPPPKPSPPPNEIQPIRKSFLDGLISITAKSSSMFKWIVLIVLATYIISVLILREFEKAGVYFKPPAVSQIGFMVLVFVSGLVLTIAKIFNRFKRKQKSGSN
jgi:hypothetical protein